MIEQDEQFKQDKVDLLFRCSLGESQTSLLADYQKAKQECSERIADNKIPRFRGVKLTGLDYCGYYLWKQILSLDMSSEVIELLGNTTDDKLCAIFNLKGQQILTAENELKYVERMNTLTLFQEAADRQGQIQPGDIVEYTDQPYPAKLSWWKCLFMGSR